MNSNNAFLYEFHKIFKSCYNLGLLEYNCKLELVKGKKLFRKTKKGYYLNPKPTNDKIDFMLSKLKKYGLKERYSKVFYHNFTN